MDILTIEHFKIMIYIEISRKHGLDQALVVSVSELYCRGDVSPLRQCLYLSFYEI